MLRVPSGSRGAPLALTALLIAGCARTAPTPAPTPRPAPPTAAPTGAPTGTPTPGAPGGATAIAGLPNGIPGLGGGEPNPRPYGSVITPQARTRRGLFTTHLQRGRLFFEIPPAELGKDILAVITIKGTQAGIGIRGTLGGNTLVRFERRENRVLLRGVNYRNVSTDSASRINRAMGIIQFLPILASFNVEAFGADSAPVIDVTRIFTGGVAEFAAAGQRVSVDQSRSFVDRVAAYPGNVEVDASQTYGQAPTPPIPGLPAGFGPPPSSGNTDQYHFSMVKLPENPMMPRYWDERVIWFRSQQLDFGTREQRVARRTLINRWRLVKRDPAAAVSEPVKPITYYVDPATPAWLVPWVKKGIEEWQPAFEAAGFRNGIVAKEVPADSAEFYNGENANVSMVRWLPSPVENAVGPSTVDPRTGEILDADVQMYHNIMNLQRSWYFTQVGHLDPRVQKLPFPDSLMGRLVQFVVAHEVGHTLGFPHNMKASSMYPVDSVRSRTWVRRMGHSASIMDYARFNYVAQPEDGIALEDLVPRVGPYDVYAVKWGYTPIPSARTPEAEKPTLDAWARMQDSVPWFRSGADDGIGGPDPGEAAEAVGDADAVRATELGVRNIKRIAGLLESATATPGEDYEDLRELYGDLIGQWTREMGHVARIVGGMHKQSKVVGQPGPVFTPVAGARQREAVRFLLDNALSTPGYFLQPNLLRKFEAQGSVDRVGGAQAGILSSLVSNDRMLRMVETDALPGVSDRYTLPQMLGDLRRGLWSELAAGQPIDAYRRRLQRVYLEAMNAKINYATPQVPQIPGVQISVVTARTMGDLRGMLRAEMRDLDRELAASAGRSSDRATRAHIEDARDQIRKMLDPKA